MKKSVGIVGITGRMGTLLKSEFIKNNYRVGSSFSKESHNNIEITPCLDDVFLKNDIVIDFSSHELTHLVFQKALCHPKPLIVCTTGWSMDDLFDEFVAPLIEKVPLIVAPNTSLGACLQLYLVKKLSKILDESYDIDIIEKHHRHKKDAPSGTACQLIQGIRETKRHAFDEDYDTWALREGPRPDRFISVNVERSGNLPGEHEVSFTSEQEMISLKHIAFNRGVFAKGALKALNWILNTKPTPGLYTMSDVLGLSD